MNIKRLVIGGFLLISVLGGCDSSPLVNNIPPSTSPETTIDVIGFKAFITYEGKPMYIIESKEAWVIEKENYVKMEDIHLSFFKENTEELAGNLTAEEGVYFFRDNPELNHHVNDIELKGNVIFQTMDGTLLKTSEVHYDNVTEKIFSRTGFEKKKVSKDQTLIIKGKSFVTDKTLRHWEDTGATMSFESHSQPDSKEP